MRRRQRGMSLVELMVAMMIGLIGILIITQAYINNEQFNRSTLGEGGAQANGLAALYLVEREARLSGYGLNTSGALGCGNIYWYMDPNYSSNVGGGTLPNLTLAPVVITVSGTPSTPDQITVMYSTEAERMLPTTVSTFNKSSSEVTVDGVDGFKENDLILLVNGSGCTLGKITQVQGAPQKLQLNPGVSAPQNPSAWGAFPTNYGNGDAILNLGNPVIRRYQIGINKKLLVSEGWFVSGSPTTQDLVDGIVDMRALYGKDDGSVVGTTANDGVVDVYNNVTPASGPEWLQVLSVRIGILARIGNYEKPSGADCDATTAVPTWSGGNFSAVSVAPGSQDRCYRYRVFETTVPLRNMIWRPA